MNQPPNPFTPDEPGPSKLRIALYCISLYVVIPAAFILAALWFS